jgi:hypothetical protein
LRILYILLLATRLFGADCITKTCSASTNFTYYLKGSPDTRPYNWGLHDDQFQKITFSPPPGYQIHIKRIYGTFMVNQASGWMEPIQAFPTGTGAAFLFALSSGTPSTGNAFPTDDQTFLYLEYATRGDAINKTFDFPLDNLLSRDNILTAKGAIFTNTTGLTFDVEASMVLVYQFEKIQ